MSENAITSTDTATFAPGRIVTLLALAVALQFHRNQFGYTKGLGDGSGYKLVGRGDDRHGVSLALVLLHQSEGLWFDGF